MALPEVSYVSVLNLIINGIPSILRPFRTYLTHVPQEEF